jgi:hypothetical protein
VSRTRRIAAGVAPVAYIVLVAVIAVSASSCGDGGRARPWTLLLVLASSVVAPAGALLARFEPKGMWITVVILSPVAGLAFSFFVWLSAYVGSCTDL